MIRLDINAWKALPEKHIYRDNFSLNCEKIRVALDISQRQMAEYLHTSLPNYKKIVQGDTESIRYAYGRYLSELTGIYINDLFDSIIDLNNLDTYPYMKMIRQTSITQRKNTRARLEIMVKNNVEEESENVNLEMIIPNGEFFDGFTLDTLSYYTVKIPKSVYEQHKKELLCAVKMPTSYYKPTFMRDDIVLIGRSRNARENEISVLIHKKEVFFRKVEITDKVRLVSIKDNMPTIVLDPKEYDAEWDTYGYVITRL